MRRRKGVITVFLAMIFSLIFVFLCTMIEVTRINSSKNQLIIASDAAMTSAMTKFDNELYETYGLLAYKESDELKNIAKEVVDANLTKNSLFDINIEKDDINISGDKNPFTEDNVFKKQSIYSMKYKGTENLALEVYEEIKEFFGSSESADNADIMEEADKEADDLNKYIEKMANGKVAANKAIIELAKNNSYMNLKEGIIGYKTQLSIADLKSIYGNGSDIEKTLTAYYEDNTIGYEKNVVLPKAYANRYVRAIFKIYKEHLNEQKVEENNNMVEENEALQNSIDKYIELLDSEFLSICREINALKTTLKTLRGGQFLDGKDGVKEGIDGVENLIGKQEEIQKIIDMYEKVEGEFKEDADASIEYYKTELNIENLERIKKDLDIINNILEAVIGEIDSISNLQDLTDFIDIKEIKVGTYDAIHKYIGDTFLKTSIDGTLNKAICEDAIIENDISISSIFKRIQIDTSIKNLTGITNMKKPSDNSIFKEFYNMFKNNKDHEPASLTKIFKELDSEAKLDASTLPNGEDGSDEPPNTLGEQLDNKIGGELGTLNQLLQNAGGFVDKVYLMEYIMTNFKEAIPPKGDRIPQMTENAGKLEYEIEAIISGKYNDKKSKNTMLDELFTLRYGFNLVSFYRSDFKNVRTFIKSAGTAISAATAGVIPEPVIRAVIIATWVAMETRYDLVDLFRGYDVPLIKEDWEQWVTNFGLEIEAFKKDSEELMDDLTLNKDELLSKDSGESAYNNQDIKGIKINYTDMIRFKLLVTDEQKLINRIQDIIVGNLELDYEGYKSEMTVKINESNANIFFNTEYIKEESGRHKFSGFEFKREYN